MFFFGHISEKQKALKENDALRSHTTACPKRKPRPVVHPENVPQTIRDGRFPRDFALYEYGGATLELIACRGNSGKVVRRPALVAKLIRRFRSDDGASVQVEMTASLRDLRQGGSPHADAIAAALTIYYQEKVPEDEKEIQAGTKPKTS